MESDLLYGDIEDAGKAIEIEQLQEMVSMEKKRNEVLSLEVITLKDQINILIEDRKQLETNIVTLHNTAKREVKRKDDIISELHKKLAKIAESK